jgi:hypothetical protein
MACMLAAFLSVGGSFLFMVMVTPTQKKPDQTAAGY